MLDLVRTFEYGGRKLGLYFSYAALHTLEKEHGFTVNGAFEKVVDNSVIAQAAALHCGLEAWRKEIPGATEGQPKVCWTIEDAQAMVMALRPAPVAKIIVDAMLLTCKQTEGQAEGKAGAGPVSTGPASS